MTKPSSAGCYICFPGPIDSEIAIHVLHRSSPLESSNTYSHQVGCWNHTAVLPMYEVPSTWCTHHVSKSAGGVCILCYEYADIYAVVVDLEDHPSQQQQHDTYLQCMHVCMCVRTKYLCFVCPCAQMLARPSPQKQANRMHT